MLSAKWRAFWFGLNALNSLLPVSLLQQSFHYQLFHHNYNMMEICILLSSTFEHSDRYIILHMVRQFGCRDMCKSALRYEYQQSNYIKQNEFPIEFE